MSNLIDQGKLNKQRISVAEGKTYSAERRSRVGEKDSYALSATNQSLQIRAGDIVFYTKGDARNQVSMFSAFNGISLKNQNDESLKKTYVAAGVATDDSNIDPSADTKVVVVVAGAIPFRAVVKHAYPFGTRLAFRPPRTDKKGYEEDLKTIQGSFRQTDKDDGQLFAIAEPLHVMPLHGIYSALLTSMQDDSLGYQTADMNKDEQNVAINLTNHNVNVFLAGVRDLMRRGIITLNNPADASIVPNLNKSTNALGPISAPQQGYLKMLYKLYGAQNAKPNTTSTKLRKSLMEQAYAPVLLTNPDDKTKVAESLGVSNITTAYGNPDSEYNQLNMFQKNSTTAFVTELRSSIVPQGMTMTSVDVIAPRKHGYGIPHF